MRTGLQISVEKARALYCREGSPPLLQQIVQIYRISVREFAIIFGIKKSQAANIISHKAVPTLHLAIDICRYFEVSVEDIFGWRFDDHGKRRPMVMIDTKTGQAFRLKNVNDDHKTMELVKKQIEDQK